MRPLIARLLFKLPGIVFFLSMASIPALPQQIISAKAGNIQFIEGEVFLDEARIRFRDGYRIQMKNEQVPTTGEGYAELLLAPDGCLRLSENASIRMRQNELSDVQLALTGGSAIIEISKKIKTDPVRVYVSKSIIKMKKDGLYRIDADPGRIRVYGGDAIADNGDKKVKIKNGRMAYLNEELKSLKFDPEVADALHRWAAERSFALYARNLLFIKPGSTLLFEWVWRGKRLYNSFYRVTVAANEDWNRYLRSASGLFQKRMEEEIRVLEDLPSIMPPGRTP